MKGMKLYIAFTFVIVVGITIIMNGLFRKFNFFTFEAISSGLSVGITYICYVWINSRQHKLRARIAIIETCITILFVLFLLFAGEEALSKEMAFSDWDWIMCVIYIIACGIASHQGKKLLETPN